MVEACSGRIGNPCHILLSHLPSHESKVKNHHKLAGFRLLESASISPPMQRTVISPAICKRREMIKQYLPVAGSYRQQNNSTSSTGEPILFADASTKPRRRLREG